MNANFSLKEEVLKESNSSHSFDPKKVEINHLSNPSLSTYSSITLITSK